MALRTYRQRVRRLSESSTDRGTTLGEATLEYVEKRGVTTRAEVLGRFSADDPESVRAVLGDLVKRGLLYRSGRGDATSYRSTRADEPVLLRGAKSEQTLSDAAWVLLHQNGPTTADEMRPCCAWNKQIERTEGETHWLTSCAEGKSCGGWKTCICGMCTQTCEESRDVSPLGIGKTDTQYQLVPAPVIGLP